MTRKISVKVETITHFWGTASMLRLSFISLCLSFFFSVPGAAQSALKTEDLVGRWGVAAYWNESDATKVTAQAKGFCSQPYIISKGRNGGAIMFEAFEGKPKEVVVQSSQIVAVGGSSGGAARNTTKVIQSWNGSTLVMNYADDEAKRRYGNMVFVRCGR
jgi:hypothetical protein